MAVLLRHGYFVEATPVTLPLNYADADIPPLPQVPMTHVAVPPPPVFPWRLVALLIATSCAISSALIAVGVVYAVGR